MKKEKSKKYLIQVRRKGTRYNEPGEVIGYIWRALRTEAIGNFNPIFCTYNKDKRVLVKSLEGDLSDPFRRHEGYLKSLYIEVDEV